MTHPLPTRSQFQRLTVPDAFWWSTGIEDTFITAPHARTARTLDEYALIGHYDRWDEDIGRIAELGVRCARYGVPWHRIQPRQGAWNWEFADAALERLLDLRISPQIDLVHYGLPPWIEGAFLHPDYPRFVAEYAARVAERYRGRITWYTPINEPRITAWYCGRLGWWPPFRRSWRGFVSVMLAIARGTVDTVEALNGVDREILPYFVDATDLFETGEPGLEEETWRRQEIVFLALDLISGRVDENHPLWSWLLRNGAETSDLDYLLEHAVDLPVIGINLYPMFSLKRLMHDAAGRLRIRMPYACGDLVTRLGKLYHERYQVPLMISETASRGSLERRLDWLRQSVDATRRLRADGTPLVGYTWWPTFALVAWAYRQGNRPVADHLAQMGLWDIVPDSSDPLRRVRTPVADAYQRIVREGARAVGMLAQADGVSAGAHERGLNVS